MENQTNKTPVRSKEPRVILRKYPSTKKRNLENDFDNVISPVKKNFTMNNSLSTITTPSAQDKITSPSLPQRTTEEVRLISQNKKVLCNQSAKSSHIPNDMRHSA